MVKWLYEAPHRGIDQKYSKVLTMEIGDQNSWEDATNQPVEREDVNWVLETKWRSAGPLGAPFEILLPDRILVGHAGATCATN